MIVPLADIIDEFQFATPIHLTSFSLALISLRGFWYRRHCQVLHFTVLDIIEFFTSMHFKTEIYSALSLLRMIGRLKH